MSGEPTTQGATGEGDDAPSASSAGNHTGGEAVAAPAMRGGRSLTEDDLLLHLALMIRTENIGVLLGAGASVPAGGWTMGQVWDAFIADHHDSLDWLAERRFLVDDERPNIERLADQLAVAAEEWERSDHPNLDRLRAAQADLFRAVVAGAVLKTTWWSGQEDDPGQAQGLSNHRVVLTKLSRARQPGQLAPWVFTTNYDLAVEWSAEGVGLGVVNGFAGIHQRLFRPGNFDLAFHRAHGRGEARFGSYHVYLAKLHGSLGWRPVGPSDSLQVREDAASAAWPALESFLAGGSQDPRLVVLPRTTKYFETTGFLYAEMFRRLAEFVSRPQTCLVTCGYSFSDAHINQMLLRGLQNPTFHLVAYLPGVSVPSDGVEPATGAAHLGAVAASLSSPQVTVVGNGERAHLDRFARDLPDPVIYTEGLPELRRQLGRTADGG